MLFKHFSKEDGLLRRILYTHLSFIENELSKINTANPTEEHELIKYYGKRVDECEARDLLDRVREEVDNFFGLMDTPKPELELYRGGENGGGEVDKDNNLIKIAFDYYLRCLRDLIHEYTHLLQISKVWKSQRGPYFYQGMADVIPLHVLPIIANSQEYPVELMVNIKRREYLKPAENHVKKRLKRNKIHGYDKIANFFALYSPFDPINIDDGFGETILFILEGRYGSSIYKELINKPLYDCSFYKAAPIFPALSTK